MRFTVLVLAFWLYHPSNGQIPVTVGANQKFVHQSEHTGFLLIETLEPGKTLYSLARKYGISINDILSANPDVDPTAIPLGFPLNIPLATTEISFKPPTEEEGIWLSYRVQPKETLYRISKVYLNTNPETIVQLNPSAAQGLTIGQVLHIGWLTPRWTDTDLQTDHTPADSSLHTPTDYLASAGSKGYVIREQKGLAVWKSGDGGTNFFVLHPTARVGTFMEITNPMLHRTITAKVAGNIPPGLYQSHVGIVVSPSTARALGVLDQQFFARWRFVE